MPHPVASRLARHAGALALSVTLTLIAVPNALRAQDAAVPPAVLALIAAHYKGYAAGHDAAAVFAGTTTPQWRSCADNGADCLSREGLAPALAGLKQAVPDLNWEVIEIIVAGNRVIVRGRGSGTPAGEFMGVKAAGKRFQIMSIDIHTLEGGRIAMTHHLEDWPAALRQLGGR